MAGNSHIFTQFHLLLDGRGERRGGLAGEVVLRAECLRHRLGRVAFADPDVAHAVNRQLEEDARSLAAVPGERHVRRGKQRHRRPRVFFVPKRRPRERQEKYKPVRVGHIGESAMINTVVEEQRIARVARHGDAVLPHSLRVIGSTAVTAEPELRRPVRGGERLERHKYRQRVR